MSADRICPRGITKCSPKIRVELLKITSGLKNIPERFSRGTLSPKQWQRIPFLD